MKKVIGTALGIAASLAMALPAYAGGANVNPCPTGSMNALCNLQAKDFGKIIGQFVTILLIIAAVISLFFLIWGGIRWITSSGDKTKVESARSTIISALVGLVIAFLAYFIFSVVLGIFGLSPSSLALPTIGK